MVNMKYAYFTLCLLCGLVILSSIVYGEKEVVDLQQWVNCGFDSCSLSVDINELPLSSSGKLFLRNAKQTDLSSAVSELPQTISQFHYEIIDKEKLVVTASIQPASQNYWIMEFGEFILDPWFNSSYPYRQNITLYSSNDTTSLSDVLVNISLNTSGLIAQGKMQSDCDDIILWDNSLDIELNYTLEGCNDPDTALWVWLPTLSHSNLTEVSVLYGNNDTASHDIGEEICDIGIETWYMADESQKTTITTLVDKCPDDYDLNSVQSDPAIVDSYVHNGTDFDGNDCLTTTTNYDNHALMSVEALFFPDDDTALDVPIIKGNLDVGASEREWSIIEANYGACNGKLSFYKMSSSCSEGGEIMACSDDIGTGSWSHYVAVRHTSDIQVYTNNNAGTPTTCTHSAYTTGDLVLGAMDCGSPVANVWDGKMDNVRIWNKDLTGAEIDIMYNYLFTANMTSGWSEEEEFEEGEPEPEPNVTFEVSYVLCVDNNTLMKNETLNINGLNNNTLEYELCVNGCDNITTSCRYPAYIENSIIIVVFAVLVIIFVLVANKLIK
jgi:hypothetical protein